MDIAGYPALTHLARAYLHQDYDLEHAAADDPALAAVADVLTGEVELARRLPAEVERALAAHPDDESAAAFWLDELDAAYVPAADGIGGRAWLRSIGDRARAAGF